MQQTTQFAVLRCHFLYHTNKLAQCCHGYSPKQCGTRFLCVLVCFLSLLSGEPDPAPPWVTKKVTIFGHKKK